jgi:flavodoxin
MSGRKIVIVKGSPRKTGNSAALAEQVEAGARAAGAQVESYYLHGMDINPCDACDACQSAPYSGCIVDDDMQTLYPKLLKGKKIGVVMTYGDSDPFNSGAINAFRTFQDGFGYVGAEIVGFVYGSASEAGEIRNNEAVMARAYGLGRKLAGAD